MKAAVITKVGEVRVVDVPRPTPQPDEVLVKVAYCGICGTDHGIYTGQSGLLKKGLIAFPLRFGHEWSGVVAEVGSAVTRFKPGDWVTADGKVTCGVCENCRAGRWGDCLALRAVGTVGLHGTVWPGAMAEYMLMTERNTFAVPEGVTLCEAALIEPAAIARNAYRNLEVVGTRVLVVGTGPIGQGAVGDAKALGASRVICAGRSKSKLMIAKRMGADACFSTEEEDIVEAVMRETDGRGVDIVVETTSNAGIVQKLPSLLSNMSAISLLGFYGAPVPIDLDELTLHKAELRGIGGTRGFFPETVRLVGEGKLHMLPILTHTIGFDDAEHMMERFEQAEGRVKMMVEISGERAAEI